MHINDLIQFSLENPWETKFPTPLMKRFLTELISSPELILDIQDEKGRVAVAVLMDKLNNPSNDACLEILGVRKDIQKEEFFNQVMAFAKKNLPTYRSGLQIAFSEKSVITEEDLKSHQLQHHYDTFEMRTDNLKVFDSSSEIIQASKIDCDRIYKIMHESFRENLDTSIPDKDGWGENFLKSPLSYFYLWKDVGYANLIVSEDKKETEIRTLGVLPSARGQSIGRKLLEHCLNESRKMQVPSCHLTVAVKNQKALNIYTGAGFQVVSKFCCFRFNADLYHKSGGT